MVDYIPGMPCLLLALTLDVVHAPSGKPLIHLPPDTRSSNIRISSYSYFVYHFEDYAPQPQNDYTNSFPILNFAD
jgi:hypothetical protein